MKNKRIEIERADNGYVVEVYKESNMESGIGEMSEKEKQVFSDVDAMLEFIAASCDGTPRGYDKAFSKASKEEMNG